MEDKTLENERHSETNELKSAIFEYKRTIRQARMTVIGKYNRLYCEKIRKKIKTKADTDKFDLFFRIRPSIYSIYISDFYEILFKISKIYKVSLNIIPTLFVSEPIIYFYTDSYGKLAFTQQSDLFSKFFALIPSKIDQNETPKFIFKPKLGQKEFFFSENEFNEFINRNKTSSGIIQQFICPASDKVSIVKIVWKKSSDKFQYFSIVNNVKMKHFNKTPQSESLSLNKSKVFTKFSEKNSLIGRLSSRFNMNFEKYSEKADFFTIKSANFRKLSVSKVKLYIPELEKMVSTTKLLLKQFLLYEKSEITEIVCDFIKSFDSKWYILNAPTIKLSNAIYKEIEYTPQLFEDIIPISRDESFIDYNIKIEKSVDDDSSQFRFSRNFGMFFASNSFEEEYFDPNDKFMRTLSKIDQLHHRKRFVSISDKFDLIADYKKKLLMDKDLNIKPIFIARDSLIKPIKIIRNLPQKIGKKINQDINTQQVTHYFSKSCDWATEKILQSRDKSIETLEKFTNSIKNSKFARINLLLKLHPLKFQHELLDVFHEKLKHFEGSREINTESCNLFCSGIKLILDCEFNGNLLYRLEKIHKPMKISPHFYDLFSNAIIETLQLFNCTTFETTHIQNLLLKISKSIIIL